MTDKQKLNAILSEALARLPFGGKDLNNRFIQILRLD